MVAFQPTSPQGGRQQKHTIHTPYSRVYYHKPYNSARHTLIFLPSKLPHLCISPAITRCESLGKSRSLAIRTAPSPIDFYIHLPKTREVNDTSLVNVSYASIMDLTIETTCATVNPNSSKTVLAGPDAPK